MPFSVGAIGRVAPTPRLSAPAEAVAIKSGYFGDFNVLPRGTLRLSSSHLPMIDASVAARQILSRLCDTV